MDNPRTSNTSRVRSSGVPIDTNQLFNFVSPGPASTFTKGVPTNTTFTTLPPTGLNVRSQHRRDDLASLLKAAPTFDNLRSSANGASTSLSKVGDKLMATSVHQPQISNQSRRPGQLQGAGIWNKTEFDNRWLQQPNAIYDMDPASRSTTTVAPDVVSSASGPAGSSQLSSTYPRPVSELQEVVNMNVIVRELLGEHRHITCVYPYPAEAVRHMLYRRLFNNGDGPAELSPEEAVEMFLYRGRFTMRQTVRNEVLAIVEILVGSMTRDPSMEYDNPESCLLDWLEHTSVPGEPQAFQDSTKVPDQGARGAATRPSSAARNRAFRTISAPSLQSLQQASGGSNPTSGASQPVAPAVTGVSKTTSQPPKAAQAPLQSIGIVHPQPQAVQQPMFIPTMAATNAPVYVTAGPAPVGHSLPYPGLGPAQYPPHVPHNFYNHPMPHLASPYPPYVGQQPWPMGPLGFPYGQSQPFATVPAPNHPIYQPQIPNHRAMARQQYLQNLDPFPNALGPATTSTAMAMASSVTSTQAGNPRGAPRTALAPAARQARTYRASSFNVAAWAQEHRPPTPPKDTTAASSSAQPNVEWKNRFGGRFRGVAAVPNLPLLPYDPNADMVQPGAPTGPSNQLHSLINQGAPSNQAMTTSTSFPFVDNAGGSEPSQWGVAKIGNIPYGLTKQEVYAFLGRNAKLVTADLGSPIHIVMDRLTGKTMDCYIEFFSVGDAQAAVNAKTRLGNIHKLGDRVAEISMSSQDELLKVLFPKAKQVEWDSGVPLIMETDEPFNSGFKSFVTKEELVMLVKHAEFPQRSTYTTRCPQRTYESMISTLYKFPWHASHLTTLASRNELFDAVHAQIRVLVGILRRTDSYSILGYPANTQTSHWSAIYGSTGLTHGLLEDLLLAGLNAPGFSEHQRWELVLAAEWSGEKFQLSPLTRWWPFEVLGRKMGIEEDVIEYYVDHLTAHLKTNDPGATQPTNLFRTFSVPSHPKRQAATLAEQADHEMSFVMQLYGYVLPAQ